MACQEQSYLPLIRNDKLILSNSKCPLESSQQFSQDGHSDGCCQDIPLLPDDHCLSTHYVSSQSVSSVSNLQESVARAVAYSYSQCKHHSSVCTVCNVHAQHRHYHQIQWRSVWADDNFCSTDHGVSCKREKNRRLDVEQHYSSLLYHHAWSFKFHCPIFYLRNFEVFLYFYFVDQIV